MEKIKKGCEKNLRTKNRASFSIEKQKHLLKAFAEEFGTYSYKELEYLQKTYGGYDH